MKKRRRWLRIFGLVFLGLLILGIGALHLFFDFSMSEEDILARFEAAGVEFQLSEVDGVSYVETGNPEGQTVLFIHGSPGGWDNFIGYLLNPDLRETYRLIAVDRVGYGGESDGDPEPSLSKQAAAAVNVLGSGESAIIVGHSMGGPIAVQVAMEHPEKVSGLVLLSAALDPELERVTWIQRLANFPLVSWMLPQAINVCNRELIPLEGELKQMESHWAEVTIPVIALHGKEDGLVPVANMDYLRQQLPEEQLDVRILESANHFIPWTQEKEVIQAILDLDVLKDADGWEVETPGRGRENINT